MKLFTLVSILTLFGCGMPSVDRVKVEESYVDSSTGTPILLEQDKRSCDESGLFKFKLFKKLSDYNLIELSSSFETYSFEEKGSLRNKMILGGEIIDRLSLSSRSGKITSKRIEKINGKSYEMCVGKDFTDKEYLESVALKVDHALISVENKVKGTRLSRFLKPINIRIHPKFSKEEVIISGSKKRTESKTLINNALFNYEFNEMIILPQGTNKNGIIPFNGVPLWDVPLVIAHEYGHYVFSKLYSSYFKNVAPYKISRAHLCYDNTHKSKDPKTKITDHSKEEAKDENTEQEYLFKFDTESKRSNGERGGKNTVSVTDSSFYRTVDENTIIGAFNEGFADLFARYTMDDQYTVNGLGCLTKSRDVYSKNFLSGTEKVFTKEVINSFLSRIKESSESCFKNTNFQSLHSIGAIFAYGIDFLYTKLGLTKEEKLNEITKWVQSVNRSHRYILSLSSEDAINYYIFLAFKNMIDQKGEDQNTIKEVFESVFPMSAEIYSL